MVELRPTYGDCHRENDDKPWVSGMIGVSNLLALAAELCSLDLNILNVVPGRLREGK